MLLEALIAILIFSMGILAIVALQAVSIKLAGDAKYRSDAALLAEELLAQMWTGDHTPATLSAVFGTNANACTAQAAGISIPSLAAAAAAACTACSADVKSAGCQSFPTYSTWYGYAADDRATATNVRRTLPGTATNPPTVSVNTTVGTAITGTVIITVRWQAPNEALPHSHVVTAQIR